MATVILIHGLGRTARSMRGLARFLTHAGFDVVLHGYASRRQPMASLVEDLRSRLDALVQNGAAPVHAVTHSLGGIVLRALLDAHPDAPIARTVMLAPPNAGSEIIDFWRAGTWRRRVFGAMMGEVALSLHTGADSLPNTLSRMPKHDVLVMTGSRSLEPWFNPLFDKPHDGKVSVASAPLNQLAECVILPVSHTFIMNDAHVQKRIKLFLNQ